MTEELKPCPFCGGKARLKSSHGFNNVSCGNCGAEYPVSFDTPQEAVSAWNSRPIEDLKDDENAWLEKNLKDYNRVMLENARLREALVKARHYLSKVDCYRENIADEADYFAKVRIDEILKGEEE